MMGMKDVVKWFIKTNRAPKGGSYEYDINPKETGVLPVEDNAYKVVCSANWEVISLSDSQIWRILRSPKLDWSILRSLIVNQSEEFEDGFDPDNPSGGEGSQALVCNRLSAEQVAYAFKAANGDCRVLKYLVYFQEVSVDQLEYVIDLIDKRWGWIETVPKIEHFSKENIDKLASGLNTQGKDELEQSMNKLNINRLKLSGRTSEAMSKAFSNSNDEYNFLIDDVVMKMGPSAGVSKPGEIPEALLFMFNGFIASSHSNYFLETLLSRQKKFSAGEINKLRYVFADTPAIFEAVLRHWSELNHSQIERIARTIARKRAILDYLADSNEKHYADQVDFILGHRIGRNGRRLKRPGAKRLPCNCFKWWRGFFQ